MNSMTVVRIATMLAVMATTAVNAQSARHQGLLVGAEEAFWSIGA